VGLVFFQQYDTMTERGEGMTEKQKKWVFAAAFAVFVVFCVLTGWLVGVPMVEFANDPERFREWVDASGIWGRVLFVGMVVLQVVVAFIPGEPVELAAGYAFGFWEGSALTMAGFLLGSWLVFALVRKFGVKLVEVFFHKNKIAELRFLQNPRKAKIIAFLLMLIPGTPKDFLSYFAGLTPLTLSQWLRIVALARIPSLVTSSLTGAAAGEENYLLSGVMLAVTLIISIAGILYYRHICKQENK
jgi:uncharacterized membrane protein YdjX (TVP38/TMEM64 family)